MAIHLLDKTVPEIGCDTGPVAKRIGLGVPTTDHTIERDYARICDPDEIAVYVNRIPYDNPTTRESLSETGP